MPDSYSIKIINASNSPQEFLLFQVRLMGCYTRNHQTLNI